MKNFQIKKSNFNQLRRLLSNSALINSQNNLNATIRYSTKTSWSDNALLRANSITFIQGAPTGRLYHRGITVGQEEKPLNELAEEQTVEQEDDTTVQEEKDTTVLENSNEHVEQKEVQQENVEHEDVEVDMTAQKKPTKKEIFEEKNREKIELLKGLVSEGFMEAFKTRIGRIPMSDVVALSEGRVGIMYGFPSFTSRFDVTNYLTDINYPKHLTNHFKNQAPNHNNVTEEVNEDSVEEESEDNKEMKNTNEDDNDEFVPEIDEDIADLDKEEDEQNSEKELNMKKFNPSFKVIPDLNRDGSISGNFYVIFKSKKLLQNTIHEHIKANRSMRQLPFNTSIRVKAVHENTQFLSTVLKLNTSNLEQRFHDTIQVRTRNRNSTLEDEGFNNFELPRRVSLTYMSKSVVYLKSPNDTDSLLLFSKLRFDKEFSKNMTVNLLA